MQPQSLDSVSIIELDINGDVLMTWMFPSVSEELASVMVERSLLATDDGDGVGDHSGDGNGDGTVFRFAKHRGDWHYSCTIRKGLPSTTLPAVERLCVCSTSSRFNPEKHFALLRLLSAAYAETGEPMGVLQGFLAANTEGRYKGWKAASFDDRRVALEGTSLRAVVRTFGQASVLLWCAMLLKKRVLVHGSRWADLQKIVRALPQLAWHRQDWGILRPMVQLSSEAQLKDLASAGVYVAATTDNAARGREDLYDLFVDVSSRTIVVAPEAKSDFALDTALRGIATKMVASAADEAQDDQALIKVAAKQTKEYLVGLRKISGGGKLTQEVLAAKFKGKPRLQTFFYNLGCAEKMT
jgi:hypothetical protein